MSVADARIAIVGGGIGGLLAATLLQERGVRDVVLFEARETLGGRILSVAADGAFVDPTVPGTDRFDLGPTWFWPDLQPQLDRLVAGLGLERYRQFEDGDMLLERAASAPPVRLRGPVGEPPAMRLAGGVGALVAALHRRLDAGRIQTGALVRRVQRTGRHVELTVELASGDVRRWRVEQVLLALPPRLAVRTLAFDPPLPTDLARRWGATPTWMAPHAKYVAIYDSPSWRAEGLSGAARSARGPMGEIHDASVPGGPAALFGFLGVPAHVRAGVPEDVLRRHCRAQLGRLFGDRAATPRADALKDWATDPFTATGDDQDAEGQHAAAPPRGADDGPWQGRLIGIGSEWSQQFPGYLAGAVDAATQGVDLVVAGGTGPRANTG